MSLQETIIQQLGVKPVIDAREEIRRSIEFLKKYLKKHPFLKSFCIRNFWWSRLDFSWSPCPTSYGRNAS